MSGSCGLSGRSVRCRCCTSWLTRGGELLLRVAGACGQTQLCALKDDLRQGQRRQLTGAASHLAGWLAGWLDGLMECASGSGAGQVER
mmetsp:Transcript_13867/g.50522  ORF Transcript_13867/g.50522 Transcript_13867/m.50522 type:complete len:88 (-) Transcript_13867:284-547(-)|eukprot:scaffold8019_cov766-Prasinococcus_capsulatus_cf.AAC.1